MNTRKNYITNFIILFMSINSIKALCIPGENCPANQGYCSGSECVCLYGFATFNKNATNNNLTYCNYHQINRFAPLIIEIFFPSIGLIFIGRIFHGLIKMTLYIIIILCGHQVLKYNIIIGFVFYIFIFLYFIDLFCLTFAIYRDGNGIKLL